MYILKNHEAPAKVVGYYDLIGGEFMNAIQYALNQVRHTIPQQVLELTFSHQNIAPVPSRWSQGGANHSIDSNIRQKVIYDRVNIDCNLYGAMQVGIDLSDVPFEQIDMATRVFEIPRSKTNGRSIVSVQSLNYLNYQATSNYVHGFHGDQRLSAARDLLQMVSSMPIVATANCQVIGDNIVMVQDNVNHLTNQLMLVCTVDNDPEMNTLNPGTFPLYSQLVELATKAYVYNQINIPMDQGVLHAGMNLGRIREIVDNYADANEMYRELFTTRWQKASFTNDRGRMRNFVGSMLGRGN